jgi:hypothetical protein
MYRLYRDLGESNTNRYRIDLLKEWFGEAERIVNKESRTIRGSYIMNSAPQRLFSLPPDLLDWFIDDIFYSTTTETERKRLLPTTREELYSFDSFWQNSKGTPIYWYFDPEQRKWGVYKYESSIRTGTNCIEILYRKMFTKMTNFYTIGTVNVTNGSPIIIGSGTTFIGNVAVEDEFGIGKLLDRSIDFPSSWSKVLTINSNTQITLSSNYTGATAIGLDYIIASPSSITNEELNICGILLAMGMAKKKDNDTTGDDYFAKAYSRLAIEVARLGETSYSREPLIPVEALQLRSRSSDYGK